MPQHDQSTRELEPDTSTPPKKKRRRFLRVLGWLLVTVVVLALIAAGLGVWTVMRSFPQTTGALEVDGLQETVVVKRDGSGIPTLTAQTTDDLFFAQGFVHAQDRFWEMDFRRHVTAGRLSELFGESQVGTDKFLRTLGWHDIAQKEVDALPAETRGYYEAYAKGVNAYLAQRSGAELSLEYAVLGLQNADYSPEPWTPVDSVAWLKAMAWDLRTNIEEETARSLLTQELTPEQMTELYPEYPFDQHPVIVDHTWGALRPAGSDPTNLELANPTVAAEVAEAAVAVAEAGAGPSGSGALGELDAALANVDALITSQGEGVGSNSWVVAGEHTATGKPLLANDPHLGAEMPSVWNQMQLRCATVSSACPFAVAGYSFSGLPGIVIGHNEQVAWGFTNLTTDVADLYIERIDGSDYWQDGKRHPITTRTETLKVAGGDDIELDIRSTAHGPIVSGLTGDFTSIAENPRFGVRSGVAESGQSVDDAARSLSTDAPSGDFAVSLRWTALEPGSTAEAIFDLNLAENFSDFRNAAVKFDVPAQNLIYADTDGNIGYQAPGRLPIRGAADGWLPQPGWDSAYDWRGYIPFASLPTSYNPESGYIVTANNAIASDAYPYFLSRDWDQGYRAARIVELLEAKIAAGGVTADDLRQIQMDQQMPAADALQRAFARTRSDRAEVEAALTTLAEWDGQNAKDSAAAAYGNVLWKRVITLMTGGTGTSIPLDDQSRFALFFEQQLEQPDSAWWQNTAAGVNSRTALLSLAAEQAYDELVTLQGTDQAKWNWGDLHAITLTNGSFGSSGVAPIEWLFNRGPIRVGGGSGVVDATGWVLDGEGYATETVPSMRMIIDPSDWDASTWINLTGASGHAFHPHYVDQADDWANGVQRPWAFTPEAVDAAANETLTLTPAP